MDCHSYCGENGLFDFQGMITSEAGIKSSVSSNWMQQPIAGLFTASDSMDDSGFLMANSVQPRLM